MIIPLRQPLTRTLFAIGALLALGTAPVQSQARTEAGDDAVAAAPASGRDVIETIAAVVHGLSANDLLNVRATASPIGLVLARVPNGTMVIRLECSTSRNTEWCRVEVPDLDGLVGWTPARYLHFARADGEAVEEAPARLPDPPVIDPSQITVGILPDPLPMPDDPMADAAPDATSGEPEIQTALLAPAGEGPAIFDAAREAEKIDGATADLALAYATRSDPAAFEVYSAFDTEAGPDQADAAGAVAETSAAPAVPVPSARPAREGEPSSASGEIVAALPSASGGTVVDDAPSAAPVSQDAAATQQAPEPIAEAEPGVEVSRETLDAPAGQPTATEPRSTVAPDTSVALALPAEIPAELARPTPVVDQPAPAETTEQPPAVPGTEPLAGQDDAGEPTLREQLAALLPSWSRPVAQATDEPNPPTKTAEPAEPVETGAEAEADEGHVPAQAVNAPVAAPLDAQAGVVRQVMAEPSESPAPVIAAEPPLARPVVMPAPVTPPAEPVVETPPVAIVAQMQPAVPAAPAAPVAGRADGIPCARYVGQPMTRCEARIVRLGDNDADVTVLWPDGGERVIRFRAGLPESANGRGEFRFTREAELNLIRVGSGERFEILDALPFAE